MVSIIMQFTVDILSTYNSSLLHKHKLKMYPNSTAPSMWKDSRYPHKFILAVNKTVDGPITLN